MGETAGEEVFLADKIVDSGFGQQDGKRYYKIRWVRFSWEPEDAINHLKDLLDDFWQQNGGVQNIKDKVLHHVINSDQENAVQNKNVDLQEQSPQLNQQSGSNPISEADLAVNVLLDQGGQPGGRTQIHGSDVNGVNSCSMESIGTSSIFVSTASTPGEVSQFSNSANSENEDSIRFEDGDEIKNEHVCTYCLKVYSSLQSLKVHMRSHAPEKTYQCDTCFKCFVERSTLKRHLLIHLNNKPFKCDHCERSFSDKSTLRRHVLTHTGHKRFHCSQCDKKFTRNEHLKQHMYIHTQEKLYKCDVCGKDFRQRSTLKNHMILHRVDSNIKCENCGAMFARQQLYDKHALWCHASTGEYQGFKCDICDKFFKESAGLKRHLVIHSGEKPFQCTVCDKSFNDRSILRRHAFTHTERKPFSCSICEKEFIRKASLMAHMASQHGGTHQVYEFVQPMPYEMGGEISLDEQGALQFVIQTESDTSDANESMNQVEVATGSMHNEGVSILAHAVCNMPNDGKQGKQEGNNIVVPISLQNNNLSNQMDMAEPFQSKNGDNEAVLTISNKSDLEEDHTEQIMQIHIVDMNNGGSQSVQTIQALVQNDSSVGETDINSPKQIRVSLDDSGAMVLKSVSTNDLDHLVSQQLSRVVSEHDLGQVVGDNSMDHLQGADDTSDVDKVVVNDELNNDNDQLLGADLAVVFKTDSSEE